MRAGLYFDQLVIDDPLLPHGREPMSGSEAYARLAGYEVGSLDRRAVAEAARSVAMLRPLVSGGLLKLVPASIQHESPREVSISYSATLFSERVPAPLLRWFHDRAEVLSMRRRDGAGWEARQGDKLEPCRAILVRLRGFDGSMTFHLTGIKKHEPVPGRENLLRITQWIPEEPPDPETFGTWIAQSVNQFLGRRLQTGSIGHTRRSRFWHDDVHGLQARLGVVGAADDRARRDSGGSSESCDAF